jgi:PAS domain S-box-containing protein
MPSPLLGLGLVLALVSAALAWHLARAPATLRLRVDEALAEARRTEAELRGARARFFGILDAAADGIISIDRQQCITLFNKGAEIIFGYRSEEVIGQPLSVLLPERFRLGHGHLVDEFAIGPDQSRRMGERSAIYGMRKDGSEFPAAASITRLRINDELVLTAIVRDITESVNAETAIRDLNRDLEARAAQLEAVNRELEAFSYSVSHDLRAPLRSIDGFSQVLLEDYAQKLDADGHDALRRVRAASQRMAQLIDDLLNLSRLTRGDLNPKTVDLSALARAAMEEAAAHQPERRVRWTVQDGVTVRGDPHLLHIALDNLVGNAWKYTARQADAQVAFGTRAEPGRRVCWVRDNGAGFDMAYANKLFGAFQRLHSQADYPGSGIGLATVARIVHRHGGEVWAESAVGEGATFYFSLPDDTGP